MKKDVHQHIEDEYFDKEIEEFLSAYTPEKVPEDKVEETIEKLRCLVPGKKQKYLIAGLMKNELSYVNISYWIISLVLLLSGIMCVGISSISPYETLLCISPVTGIIGAVGVIGSKMGTAWELEKSFRYSYGKVILSRILIVVSLAAVINIVIGFAAACNIGFDNTARLMASWIAPMCIMCTVNIILLRKTSAITSFISTSAIWIIILSVFNNKIIAFIRYGSNMMVLCAVMISILIFTMYLYRTYKDMESYEGEVIWN